MKDQQLEDVIRVLGGIVNGGAEGWEVRLSALYLDALENYGPTHSEFKSESRRLGLLFKRVFDVALNAGKRASPPLGQMFLKNEEYNRTQAEIAELHTRLGEVRDGGGRWVPGPRKAKRSKP